MWFITLIICNYVCCPDDRGQNLNTAIILNSQSSDLSTKLNLFLFLSKYDILILNIQAVIMDFSQLGINWGLMLLHRREGQFLDKSQNIKTPLNVTWECFTLPFKRHSEKDLMLVHAMKPENGQTRVAFSLSQRILESNWPWIFKRCFVYFLILF